MKAFWPIVVVVAALATVPLFVHSNVVLNFLVVTLRGAIELGALRRRVGQLEGQLAREMRARADDGDEDAGVHAASGFYRIATFERLFAARIGRRQRQVGIA